MLGYFGSRHYAARRDIVARLHGASDGDVVQDRIRVWKERLSTPAPNQFVVLAEEDDDLIGFACAYGDHDETWRSFLDNIHVDPSTSAWAWALRSWPRSRRGVERTTPAVVSTCGLLEQNRPAQRFYKGLGASEQGGEISEPPGGGQIHGRRYAWKAVSDLPRP